MRKIIICIITLVLTLTGTSIALTGGYMKNSIEPPVSYNNMNDFNQHRSQDAKQLRLRALTDNYYKLKAQCIENSDDPSCDAILKDLETEIENLKLKIDK